MKDIPPKINKLIKQCRKRKCIVKGHKCSWYGIDCPIADKLYKKYCHDYLHIELNPRDWKKEDITEDIIIETLRAMIHLKTTKKT